MAGKRSASRKSNKAGLQADQQGKAVDLPTRERTNSGNATAPNPEYRFLQLSEGDFKPSDSAARKLIRSHVMRNYFQEKRTQSEDTSLTNSASTVIAKNKLKGRWRLGKQPLPVEPKRVIERKEVKDAERAQKCSRTPSAAEEVQHSPLSIEHSSYFTQISTYDNGAILPKTPHLEMFQASVRDPFNSMPVAASNPRTNRLMHFYQTEFTINILAQNPTGTFYSYVVGHEGLLHGMLAIVALYMHGHRGINVKADILYHRGQAMQLIHRGLGTPSTADLSSLLASMVSITVFENLCGNYYNARAHLVAIRSLIKSAGGIRRFAENDSVPRATAWAEYHYAAATRTIPGFRYSPTECAHPDPPIPEKLMFDAARGYPYGLALIDKHGHNIYNIFRRLHILAVASSSEWEAVRNTDADFRFALSNMMLNTEYDLLALSYQLKSEISPSDTGKVNLFDVCDCLCVAGQIFHYAGLRIMPLGTRVVDLYISRLRRALHSEALIDNWRAHACWESLLWTLAVTATAANGRSEYLPAMIELRKLCGMMGIGDVDEMVAKLKGFAWNDSFNELGRNVLMDLFRRASYPLGQHDDRHFFPDISEMQPSASRVYSRFRQ